jgi:hypothetical protein
LFRLDERAEYPYPQLPGIRALKTGEFGRNESLIGHYCQVNRIALAQLARRQCNPAHKWWPWFQIKFVYDRLARPDFDVLGDGEYVRGLVEFQC